eukprot:14139382-Alexandrium_andersonii.AAC.1
MLTIRAAELLRTCAQQLPPPRMLFDLHDDPEHREFRRLRASVVSSWAGPKCKLIEIDMAAQTFEGQMSSVCVVPTCQRSKTTMTIALRPSPSACSTLKAAAGGWLSSRTRAGG